jgi:predicted metal-dependent phosphoesterase TrpH
VSKPDRNSASRYDATAEPYVPSWPVEVDLHLHTTASDGVLTPTQLIERVAAAGLRVAAISDHDTTAGVDEAMSAAERHPSLTIIPAIEFGARTDETEVHLLGHFIDHCNTALQDAVRAFREYRVDAARQMVQKLASLGLPVSWERVQELAGGSVGRPHIARAMVEAGHVETVAEAFDRYIGDNGPARIPRPKLAPVDALELVHKAGGVGTVAHPRTVKDVEQMLPSLAEAGLAGIEVYAEKYGAGMHEHYLELAEKFGLVPSGGTDYHAFGSKNEVEPGMSGPPPDTAARLFERACAMHGGNVGFKPRTHL